MTDFQTFSQAIAARFAEIAEHNEGVKTRQVMRSVYKPWKGAVQRDNAEVKGDKP